MVCNNGSNNITIWYNDQSGGFQNDVLLPVGASPTSLYLGDVDGNGKPDIAVVNSGEDSISVIMNRNSGALETLAAISVTANPLNIWGDDFNSDGIKDLAFNSGNQILQILPGRAEGLGYKAPTENGPQHLTSADWNGDGNQDIAVSYTGINEISILLGRGNGLFSNGTTITNVIGVRGLTSADLNKDNKMDLVVSIGTSCLSEFF